MSGFLHALVPPADTDLVDMAPLLRHASDKRDLRDSLGGSFTGAGCPSSPSSFGSLVSLF